jgi:uncharacterized protein DUF1569
MKSLYQPELVQQVRDRLGRLKPDSTRQWGKMTPAQAVTHCAISMEMAVGENKPPRVLLGRIIGGFVKPLALKENKPFQKNSPTAPSLVVKDDRDLNKERERLSALIERFAADRSRCTDHPHAFFGKMTPDEWSVLMYKHLDHHLTQFGV